MGQMHEKPLPMNKTARGTKRG